jgi:hypothetical protein
MRPEGHDQRRLYMQEAPATKGQNGTRTTPRLRDLIYLDVAKCGSIFSQFEGGLLREVQSSTEVETKGGLSGELNVGFAKLGSRLGASEKGYELVSRVLHHDIMARTEDWLSQEGCLLDINDSMASRTPTEEEIRGAVVAGPPYVRAQGWVMLEDYARMTKVAASFNELMEFLKRCAGDAVKKTPEYQRLISEMEDIRTSTDAISNRDRRATEKARIRSLEKTLEDMVSAASTGGQLDEWLVTGIMKLVELFKNDQINLRLYPFESAPGFQFLSNLKRECFLDGDIENFVFAYGARPNVKLTAVGLVTSLPPDGELPFDPLQEFLGAAPSDQTDQQKAFELGFRRVFDAFEDMEKMVRFVRYPNVTLYPIALYRTIA